MLIDFMILSMVALAILSAYMASYKSVDLAKMRMTAVTLANEKMETLRNMPYDNLATVQGAIYPPGEILDHEIVNRNGDDFDVYTVITYVDDPYDGNAAGTISGKPKDVYPYDYKKIEINIGKVGKNSRLAKLTSTVSARAAETPGNTGILVMCVIDAAGNPITEADVSIKNTSLNPAVDMQLQTGEDGCLMVPKLPPDSHNNYALVVSKDGYSTEQTYARTAQNPNALQPDVNIIVQQVTNQTLAIDRLSTMNILLVDKNNNPMPNISFTLTLKKLIYNNPDTYKFSNVYTTNAEGRVSIPDLEFGNYSLSGFSSGKLISTTPMQEIELKPETTLEVTAVLAGTSSNPAITNFSPISASTGSIVSIAVNGENFNNGAAIKLVAPDGREISGSDVEVHPHDRIIADFDLTGAILGNYDLVITDIGGESVTQNDSLTVTAD